MDWKTFIVELIKALVWPGLIGYLIFRYRRYVVQFLVVFIRMFKGFQTLKYGDLELATKTVNAAIDVNDTKVEDTTAELKKPELPADERDRLTNELRQALEESARLRLALESLQTRATETAVSIPNAARRHRARTRMMDFLISHIGIHEIVRLADADNINELSNLANGLIHEATQPGNRPIGFTPSEYLLNQENNIIAADGYITTDGLNDLIRRARLKLSITGS